MSGDEAVTSDGICLFSENLIQRSLISTENERIWRLRHHTCHLARKNKLLRVGRFERFLHQKRSGDRLGVFLTTRKFNVFCQGSECFEPRKFIGFSESMAKGSSAGFT